MTNKTGENMEKLANIGNIQDRRRNLIRDKVSLGGFSSDKNTYSLLKRNGISLSIVTEVFQVPIIKRWYKHTSLNDYFMFDFRSA